MNDTDRQKDEKAIESVEDLEVTSTQAEEIEGGSSIYPNFRGGVYVAAADVNADYVPKATDVTLKRGVIG